MRGSIKPESVKGLFQNGGSFEPESTLDRTV